tara:strand:- start:1293 stop:1400 length:108 start_codon:yes stop_codon:yes gene_type:complete
MQMAQPKEMEQWLPPAFPTVSIKLIMMEIKEMDKL